MKLLVKIQLLILEEHLKMEIFWGLMQNRKAK